MKKIIALALASLFSVAVWTLLADADKCPISGEPANGDISLSINGKKVNLCCEKCKKTYEAKLNVQDKGPDKCPISGKPAKAEYRILHTKTEVAYFCCDNCPKTFAENNKFEVKDGTVGKCPMSGKDALADKFLVHNGEKIYFCCDNCPKGYLKKIGAVDAGPDKCPISGNPAKAESKMVVTKTEAVYFCCPNCPAAYEKANFAAK